MYICIGREMLPISPKNIGKEISKQGLKQILRKAAPELAKSIEEADPMITAAELAAATHACRNSMQ